MGMIDTLRSAVMGPVMGAVRDLVGSLQSMETEIEAAQREREDLLCAPTCRADVKAFYEQWIDGCRADFQEMLGKQLTTMLRKPDGFSNMKSQVAYNHMAVVSVRPVGGEGPTSRSMDRSLLALLGPQLKPALFKVIDEMPWPAPEGLPLSQRRAKVAALDRKIEQLQADARELRRVAADAGIIIDREGV
jgi:hypothetical protein